MKSVDAAKFWSWTYNGRVDFFSPPNGDRQRADTSEIEPVFAQPDGERVSPVWAGKALGGSTPPVRGAGGALF